MSFFSFSMTLPKSLSPSLSASYLVLAGLEFVIPLPSEYLLLHPWAMMPNSCPGYASYVEQCSTVCVFSWGQIKGSLQGCFSSSTLLEVVSSQFVAVPCILGQLAHQSLGYLLFTGLTVVELALTVACIVPTSHGFWGLHLRSPWRVLSLLPLDFISPGMSSTETRQRKSSQF